MIKYVLDHTPAPIKWSSDGAIFAVGVAHFMGWWKDNVGTLAATAGFIWILIQVYYFIKDKRK
jgi:hypothetical protein